ncbi:MAG TPA: hypothetical protein VG992_04845 [Candidatus Saccharimonadales bacterium]|nr:hypothetical protein [Candidatus Saccharimonadales bacterium]
MYKIFTSGGLQVPLRPTGRLVLGYGYHRSLDADNAWFQHSDFESTLPAEAKHGHGPRQRYFRIVSQYAQLGLLDHDDRLPKELQPTGRRIRPEGHPTPYKYLRITDLGRTALLENELSEPATPLGTLFTPDFGRVVDAEIAALTGLEYSADIAGVMASLPRPRSDVDLGHLVVAESRLVEQ